VKIFKVTSEMRLSQPAKTIVPLMRRYYAFATQIGCVVVEDNVQATARHFWRSGGRRMPVPYPTKSFIVTLRDWTMNIGFFAMIILVITAFAAIWDPTWFKLKLGLTALLVIVCGAALHRIIEDR
jgi:hypothetical protein